MLSMAGKLPMGRNLICLVHCSICKTLASVIAHQIHIGEQQVWAPVGSTEAPSEATCPALCTALPELSPSHQGWSSPAQGSVYLLSGSPEQLG